MAIQRAIDWRSFRRSAPFLGAMAVSFAAAASAQAGLMGSSVTASLNSPNGVIGDPTPVSLTDTVTVGAGQEINPGNGSNIGGFMLPAEFIDFSDASIWVRVAAGNTLNNGTPVTGYASPANYVFSGLNPLNETITGISVNVGANEIANLAALSAANWISLTNAHTITMALDPILFVNNVTGASNAFADVTINLRFQPTVTTVPEPATVLLIALGMGALAWSRKRA